MGLEIHVDYPVHYFVPSRSVTVIAYAVKSDGTYNDVSSEVGWASTHPDVIGLRQGVAITATAMTPGDSEIRASYQGFSDVLSLTVRPWQDFEDSFLRLQFASVLHPGHMALAVAYLNGVDQDVTALATWASSNSQVLTVQAGRVMALKPGTARITVSYAGFTDDCIVSVHPSTIGGGSEAVPQR